MRVVGPAPGGGDFVELIINERRLRMAMLAYSWSILQVSLVICGVVAALLYLVLQHADRATVKALADALARFPGSARERAHIAGTHQFGPMNSASSNAPSPICRKVCASSFASASTSRISVSPWRRSTTTCAICCLGAADGGSACHDV